MALCEAQRAAGHRCVVVSDTLAPATDAEYIPLPLDDRRFLNRLRNIQEVTRICREREIDVIHAHSRASSWVAHYVTRRLGIGYVSTVHGRQGVHASSRLQNVYGCFVVAVCEHLVDHLTRELNVPRRCVRLIRNGLA